MQPIYINTVTQTINCPDCHRQVGRLTSNRTGNDYLVNIIEVVEGRARVLRNDFHNCPRPTERANLTDEEFDGGKLVAAFRTAAQHLRYPKIVFERDGLRVTLRRIGRGPNEGCINVTDGGRYPNAVWYGRIEQDGLLTTGRAINDEVLTALRAFARDPQRYAAEHGRATGACCFCATRLTDPRSLTVGYGPICADHYGLPWGEVSEEVASYTAEQVRDFEDIHARDRYEAARYDGDPR